MGTTKLSAIALSLSLLIGCARPVDNVVGWEAKAQEAAQSYLNGIATSFDAVADTLADDATSFDYGSELDKLNKQALKDAFSELDAALDAELEDWDVNKARAISRQIADGFRRAAR